MDLLIFKFKFSPSLQEEWSFPHSTVAGRGVLDSSCSCAPSYGAEIRKACPMSRLEIPYVSRPELIHQFHPLLHQLLLGTDNINLDRT